MSASSAAKATKEAVVVTKELVERIPYEVVRRRFRHFYGSRYAPATAVFNDKVIDHWMQWPYDNVPHPEDTIDEAYVLKKHPSIDLPQEVYDKRPFYAKFYVPNQRKHVINSMIMCEKELQKYYKRFHETGDMDAERGFMFEISKVARVIAMLLLMWVPVGIFQFIFEEMDIYKLIEDTWMDKKKVCVPSLSSHVFRVHSTSHHHHCSTSSVFCLAPSGSPTMGQDDKGCRHWRMDAEGVSTRRHALDGEMYQSRTHVHACARVCVCVCRRRK